MTRKNNDSPEEYVKNYQLDITNGKLDSIINSVGNIQKQVSDFQILMQTRPTNEQVDDKISVAVVGLQKDISTSAREIRLELGPPVRTGNRLLWAILSGAISVVGALILLVITLGTKQ